MSKILCYGGSFDPIHLGHLRCARVVAETAGFDKVMLIPCAQSPLKQASADGASAVDRLAMCKLVASGDEIFQINDLELQRGGRSFTIDTIRQLKQQGMAPIYWLIGTDQLAALPQWHQPQALVQEAALVIMNRAGYAIDWSRLPQWMQVLRSNVIEIPPVDISSTEIRSKVARGESIAGLVPIEVEQYIRQRRLYRERRGDPL